MKVRCAWCEKAGKPADMYDKEPLDDPAVTHGICPEHRAEVERQLADLLRHVDP